MPYAVIAQYQCAEADADLVRDALLRMREQTLAEPGNLTYVVHQGVDDPGSFILYEQYLDQASFEAHTQSAHFADLIVATVRPRLTDRTVAFAEVI